MKSAILGCAALAMTLAASAQDTSRDSELVMSVGTDEMRYLIDSAGYTVKGDLTDAIGLIGEDDEGAIFGIQGKACDDAEQCLGVEMFFLIEDAGDAATANAVNLRWSAIKSTALDDGNLMLSRYEIVDHGQTLQNLRLSLVTAKAIASTYRAEYTAAQTPVASVAAADIDWGDDTGSYANDDACDDARFHDDGDEWSYQREHVLRDATDCRTLYNAGSIQLHLDFGDNSGEYANDDSCDDNRFTGEGRSVLMTDSHVKRDAADCVAAYRAETINRS